MAYVVPRVVPNPTGSGVAVVNWAHIRFLVEKGHRVTCLVLTSASSNGRAASDSVRTKPLSEIGVELLPVAVPNQGPSRTRTALRLLRGAALPATRDFYPAAGVARPMAGHLRRLGPDVIYLFTAGAVASASRVGGIPRLAAQTDLDHLALLHRLQYDRRPGPFYAGAAALQRVAIRRLPAITTRLLSECDAVVCHAAHHAQWLREHGVPGCTYLPNPVVDEAGPEWEASRASHANHGKPKVLMAGHLQGIATLSGMHLFADRVLPALEAALGPDAFEVHVTGADALPADLAPKLARPSVRLRGYVDDIRHEFLSCDVLLVPTPIDLGFRTRIAEGFSYGCCVVAHSANALGMPELVHEENGLLADSGEGMAAEVVRALRDASLRQRLGANARATYEERLHWRVVCGQVTAELERIAGAGREAS